MAMSEQNQELVRAVFRGWDEAGVEGMLPFFHDDIEYLPMEEDGLICGHDEMRRYFARWMEPWDEFRVGPTEMQDSGDYVFNGTAVEARGRGSGIVTTLEYWQVWLVRDGKAARWEEYLDRGDALEAAGLSK
jgi:ketosteroid isomerase-like protein